MYTVTIINGSEEITIHHHMANDCKVLNTNIILPENEADSFAFDILPNNPGFGKLQRYKTLIKVFNNLDGVYEFEGRVSDVDEETTNNGMLVNAIECEGELSYLNDSSQLHGEYHDVTVEEYLEILIDNHNKQLANDKIDKSFVVGNVTVIDSNDSLYRYSDYASTWENIKSDLLDSLGGILKIRKENGVRYLDYLADTEEIGNVELRIGKNIQSWKKDTTNKVITHLIPLGNTIESEDEETTDASKARLTIEEVNNGINYIVDEAAYEALGTIIFDTKNWDEISQAANLLSTSKKWLEENNKYEFSFEITALDLHLIGLDAESFKCGLYYKIYDFDENLKVIQKTININEPNKNTLKFGSKKKTVSQMQAAANKRQKEFVNLKTSVTLQGKKIGNLSQELKNAKDQLSKAENTIDNITNSAGNVQSNIDKINASINQIDGSIEEMKKLIDELQEIDYTTKFEEIENSLDDINGRLTNLETGGATANE